MPELAELAMMAITVNRSSSHLFHSWSRTPYAKLGPDLPIPPSWKLFRLSAQSRGKELHVLIHPVSSTSSHPKRPPSPSPDPPVSIHFRAGMSAHVRALHPSQVPRHAHLTFLSDSPTPLALCWVDGRRFGRWRVNAAWDDKRSPCPYSEYALWRKYVVEGVAAGKKTLVNHKIGEALLNQQWFNGIGNVSALRPHRSHYPGHRR